MQTSTPDDRPGARFLAEELAKLPSRYSPIAHLCASAGIGLLAIASGYVAIGGFRWKLLLVALAFLVIANLVEWLAHKHLLHQRIRFFEILYDQHVPRHHVFYVEGRMAVASRREWRFVLMPARGVLGIALLAIPLALVVGALFGTDFGWVAVMTVGSYTSFYEVSHLCYHLQDDHWVMRPPIAGRALRWLRRHHARHHDPRLMRKWNFNVTVPLWDFLLGTNHVHPETPSEP